MAEILSSNLDDFLARFYDFYDGLIRDANISFMGKHTKTRVIIKCSVQDRETEENEGWVNLTLDITDVIELILIESNITCVALSNGIKVGFFEGNIYLDLCPFTEEPQDIDDFKKSRFLVAGNSCVWSISPYSE